MRTYIAKKDFWHNGLLVKTGTPITLSDSAARYLAHALSASSQPAETEAKPEPVAPVAPVEPVEPVQPAKAEPLPTDVAKAVIHVVKAKAKRGDGQQG